MSRTVCRTSTLFRRGIIGVLSLTAASLVLGAPAHYLVFETDDAGVVEPVFSRKVQLAAPLESKSDDDLKAARALASAQPGRYVMLELEAADGRVIHRDVIDLPEWIRGEFHGRLTSNGAWEIDNYRVPAGRRSFVARVPDVVGARLVVETRIRSAFDLDALAASSKDLPLAPLAATEGAVVTKGQTGDPANRVDLLLIGDGYTAADQSLFDAHAAEFDTWFFTITPYAEYKNFVNTDRLFVPSSQAGADHPPYSAACPGDPSCCADPDALTDPLAGTYVDTAFDARFCAYNIHRLLVVNESAVLAAASAVPDWDMIVVAVNDATYGGSGGTIPVTSVHDDALEIVQHEYGHSFTNLADEYDTPYPGFPACSDVTGPACEANVTDETVRELIKWSPWIDPATPVPTPENLPEHATDVGLFEGARYQATGVYRARDVDCVMHFLGLAFGEICAQQYVKRLYVGGWGVPASGIDPVEPGSENPPTGAVVDGTIGATFSVDLLQPVGSPPLDVVWLVDTTPQPPQTGVPVGTFEFTSSEPGLHDVAIRVEDVTPLVHPALAGPWLQSARNWSVDVGPAAGPGRVGLLRMGKSTITPGNLVMTWSASCSPGAAGYAIYEGVLRDFYSHTMKDCSDDGTPLTEEIQPAAGDAYYLVVPLTADAEGSYGTASPGVERPNGAAVCQAAHVISACP